MEPRPGCSLFTFFSALEGHVPQCHRARHRSQLSLDRIWRSPRPELSSTNSIPAAGCRSWMRLVVLMAITVHGHPKPPSGSELLKGSGSIPGCGGPPNSLSNSHKEAIKIGNKAVDVKVFRGCRCWRYIFMRQIGVISEGMKRVNALNDQGA